MDWASRTPWVKTNEARERNASIYISLRSPFHWVEASTVEKLLIVYNFQQTNCVKFLHGVEVDETRTGVDNVDKDAINAGADAMVGQVT